MPNPDQELTVEECRGLFRIKPLEWEWFEVFAFAPRRGWKTKGIFIVEVSEEIFEHRAGIWHGNGKVFAYFSVHHGVACCSFEAGKQLAEHHWQEYIKQALLPAEPQQ